MGSSGVIQNAAGTQETPGSGDRVQQTLALTKAAISITGELELESLLQRIVDVTRELVNCKYAALGVLGDDGYIARFPTSGISAVDREKLGAPPRGHGLLGVMLRAGQSLRIPDIGKDPRRVGFPPHHPPMTSLLGVPIFVRGKLVGDLYLTDKIGGPEFSEEDEWLVELLATHAATALTNAQLHEANMRTSANLLALLRVTRAINRSVILDEVISLIVQSAVELLGVSGAAVYLIEHPHGEATAGAYSGPGSDHFLARYAFGLEESLTTEVSRLPVQGSVAGRAVRSGITQVVEDTTDEPEVIFPRLAGKVLRSLVAVPLAVGDQMLGVLSAYSDRPHAFNSEAVQLLEAFGAQASTAISNANLYEEARRGREAAEREQHRLEELEQMKDEFLSTAAHELRTPLTTIRMSAGLAHEQLRLLAETEGLDPRLVDLVGLIEDGSARLQSLVNDLLDLTRLEQGKTALTMWTVDLREVVRESVNSTRALFDSKHQNLTLHVPETHCKVRGDAQRLEQVIINLLSNANKYSPANSPIEVRVVRTATACRVMVRDKGPGVPADDRDLIFERFYRSSLHRNDRTPSTGLGLPIARAIAEMHQGRVWVEPAPGGGSIFTLSLPVSSEL